MGACCGKKGEEGGICHCQPCTWELTKKMLVRNIFSVVMVLGVFLGIALGLILRQINPRRYTPREIMYIQFVGDLFVRILMAIIVPLIVASLITAIGTLDLSVSGKIGARAVLFYGVTTFTAVGIGVLIASIFRPGAGVSIGDCGENPGLVVDTFLDLFRNIFPPNVIGAALEATRTTLTTNDSLPVLDWVIKIDFVRGSNMMGIITISIAMGVILGQIGETGKPLLMFFESLGETTILLTTKIVYLAPVCICFLIAGQLLQVKSTYDVFRNLGGYMACVVFGLFLHVLVILPLYYFLATRKNPYLFLGRMTEAIVTALGTASSMATLPVTLKCVEEYNKVDTHVTRFVVPIGATINMDGTALFLPIVIMYLGQMCGMDLSFGRVIAISFIATATSIGAAGIPQSGMIIMMTAFAGVGLPFTYLAYVLPVDWFLLTAELSVHAVVEFFPIRGILSCLFNAKSYTAFQQISLNTERLRTTVNILGDAFVAGIVEQRSQKELAILNKADIEMQESELISSQSSGQLEDGEGEDNLSAIASESEITTAP